MMLAFLPVDAPASGTDYTQIFVTLIVTSGVIVTAVFGYLANRAGKAAKVAAEQTQEANSSDHGKVAQRLDRQDETLARMSSLLEDLKDGQDHMDGRMHDLGKRQLTITDQLVVHQQWHLDHPNKESY